MQQLEQVAVQRLQIFLLEEEHLENLDGKNRNDLNTLNSIDKIGIDRIWKYKIHIVDTQLIGIKTCFSAVGDDDDDAIMLALLGIFKLSFA